MKSDGFLYPSSVREMSLLNLHFPNVYWEIRKTTDDSQCVSRKESQKSFFKQSSSQMKTPVQDPVCI